MVHILMLVAAQRDDLKHFNELLASWPVRLVALLLFAGLAVLAFTRVSRDFEDGARGFRAAVVALGVFLGLEFLLGASLGGSHPVPVWLEFIAILWLFGLWLYYFVRFMTRQRSGPPDVEAQGRGAELERSLTGMEQELRGRPHVSGDA